MALIEDLDRGVTDMSLIAGRVLPNLVGIIVQSLVIVAMALAIGVSFDGGPEGVMALVLAAGLLGTGFSALSNALALVTRKEETLISTVSFLQLPLTFLSTAFMQATLMPDWITAVARYNPVDWAIRAGREAAGGGTDWAAVAGCCGLLAGFAVACLLLAARAFRAYQEQV
jgi:ABC-2 type transport system permease protein